MSGQETVKLNLHITGSKRIKPINVLGMPFKARDEVLGAESSATSTTSNNPQMCEATPVFFCKSDSMLGRILNTGTSTETDTNPTYVKFSKELTDEIVKPRREETTRSDKYLEIRKGNQELIEHMSNLAFAEKQEAYKEAVKNIQLKLGKDFKESQCNNIGSFLDFLHKTAKEDPVMFDKLQTYEDWKLYRQQKENEPKHVIFRKRMKCYGSVPFKVCIYNTNEITFTFDPNNVADEAMTFNYEDIDKGAKPLTMNELVKEIVGLAREYDLFFDDARFLKDNNCLETAIAITKKVVANMTLATMAVRYETSYERDIEKLSVNLKLSYRETIKWLEERLSKRTVKVSETFGWSLEETVVILQNYPIENIRPHSTSQWIDYTNWSKTDYQN